MTWKESINECMSIYNDSNLNDEEKSHRITDIINENGKGRSCSKKNKIIKYLEKHNVPDDILLEAKLHINIGD